MFSPGLHSQVGTPMYMAPEVIESSDIPMYDHKADIWSLGCVMYELATLSAPVFQMMDKADVLHAVQKAGYSPILCDMIDAALQRDPAKRPNASQLLQTIRRHVGESRHIEKEEA